MQQWLYRCVSARIGLNQSGYRLVSGQGLTGNRIGSNIFEPKRNGIPVIIPLCNK